MSQKLDRRLTPARSDLAASYLKGQVEADCFKDGAPMEVRACIVDVRREPRPDAAVDTQVLFGERVEVYDEEEGWVWVQLDNDQYVGWIAANTLWSKLSRPTHRVCVPRTFIYPGPSIKLPPLLALPLGAEVEVIERRGDFWMTTNSCFIYASHLTQLDESFPDFVAIAEKLLNAPYLWGGKSWMGIDCSGLVQLSLLMRGYKAPRDSDLQEQQVGKPIDYNAGLQRGDLIFWKGHVGIMRDESTLLHANGTHMLVSSEPLSLVRDRNLQAGAGDITSYRRL
ncbi:peptidase P60 [Methylocystaceae bacterium]|nr:peptidase P60 [Methylocystaceae bacterium]